jgi:hypothetical protein
MATKKLYILCVVVTGVMCMASIAVSDEGMAGVSGDSTVSVQLNNMALNEALKELARKFSLEVRGIPVSPEPVTMNVSASTLDETLRRMLRGYNYVLIRPEDTGKTILMVLSKAGRGAAGPDVPAQAIAPPASSQTASATSQQTGTRTESPRTSPRQVESRGAAERSAGGAGTQAGEGQGRASQTQAAKEGEQKPPEVAPPSNPQPVVSSSGMPSMPSAFGGASWQTESLGAGAAQAGATQGVVSPAPRAAPAAAQGPSTLSVSPGRQSVARPEPSQ